MASDDSGGSCEGVTGTGCTPEPGACWDAHPEQRPAERPDLVKEVRPVLDRITMELPTALRETERVRAGVSREARPRVVAVRSAYERCLDGPHREGLVRALPSVCGA